MIVTPLQHIPKCCSLLDDPFQATAQRGGGVWGVCEVKGDFVDMAELLRDNLEAERRRARSELETGCVKSAGSPHRMRLNHGFRSDLRWWACFLPAWNGKSMMAGVVKGRPQVVMTSDASGSWGCGAYLSSGEWFQLELSSSWDGIHITMKELFPIVIGAAVWGSQWKGVSVLCRCDNAAVVAIVNSGTSKVERAMHLMRSLFFFLADGT